MASWLASSAAAMSTLTGSSWRLKVDVGLEPGSYLARSDWGASGGRLRFNMDVDFEETPATMAEELVGPLQSTRTMAVQSDGSFVGFEGEKAVSFTGGGWCVQRGLGVSSMCKSKASLAKKPEHICRLAEVGRDLRPP